VGSHVIWTKKRSSEHSIGLRPNVMFVDFVRKVNPRLIARVLNP
jgi:hypothetical protein